MVKEFDFRNENTMRSYDLLTEADKETFHSEFELNFEEYITKCMLGARHYLMGQDPKSIPRSIIKFRILQTLHYLLLSSLMFFAVLKIIRLCSGVSD